ncbi:phosphoribosylglycinamide formyltransferase [Candidatus Sumerlaeota bacterium]|nr:phosphoribosylglycinamide formyltransferase [Candidatus Sumerlaeota bacterium]
MSGTAVLSQSQSELRVAVLVSGRGSNLKALIEAKAAGKLARVRFAAVFSDVENPPAFDHAAKHGVPTLHLNPKKFASKKDYETAAVALLRGAGAEWIVLAGYMRIVGPTLLDAFPNRVINIHPALLPSFPGLHAQKQAVDYGVKLSGCTVHFVDSGMDTGPIILQKTVPCYADDTEETLAARILEQEHKALPEALELISQGVVRVEGRKVIISK